MKCLLRLVSLMSAVVLSTWAGGEAMGGEAVRPPGAPAEPTITINEFVVDGNTLLTEEEIQEVLQKHRGPAKRMWDLDAARIELEKAYHARGYPTVLVQVPEQTVQEGRIRLEVIEARLGRIRVTGNRYFSRHNILDKLPSLKVGAVISEPVLLRELEAVNVNPDLKVSPILKAGSDIDRVNLELKTKDRLPLHVRVEADNRGSITTPRNRVTAQAQYTNLFDADHVLTVQTVQTPTDLGAVQTYGASYVIPLRWPNHLLSLYASRAISNSVLAGTTLSAGGGDVGIAGDAVVAGVRYLAPLEFGWIGTHQMSVGADFKHLGQTQATFPGDLGSAVVTSPIQYTLASIGYTGVLPDSLGVTTLTLNAKGYVAGLIPGGTRKDFGGDPSDPFNKPGVRRGSTGTFGVVQGGLERTHLLPKNFELLLRVDGQWATQPLVPAEEYFAGGLDTVRGYVNYEAIGDNAVRWRAELTSPELPYVSLDRFSWERAGSQYRLNWRMAIFYDAADLWVQNPSPGQVDRFRLEGAGFGLRAKLPREMGTLRLDQAWALHDGTFTHRGDSFLHFSLVLTY